VYVIGDNANTPYSGMAQTAIHDATFVADNLRRKAEGKKLKSYVVKQPITVIPAGPKWAAVLWGKVRMYGWLGWVLREMGDLVGFHDYEPWPKAIEQWSTEFITEESCPVCVAATNTGK
jgi:NADH dehydrogenase FAD-containing subunit